MNNEATWNQAEFRSAFLANEKQVRINTGKVASILVICLMPLGVTLDFFEYHDKVGLFLLLRLFCSVLVGAIWFLYTTDFGQKHYKWLGLPIPLLPALFICGMIYIEQGPVSPYYAGLNLILLAVSVVVHWSTLESLIATGSILLFYFIACSFKGTREQLPIIYNNVYFLVLTGIIVVTGNHFFNQLRFREFALNYELDKSRKALEISLAQLKENEAQLIQSEKLASLGRMSAGMIHEINNPLNFAITGLFTLRKKGKYLAPEQQGDYVDILKDVEEGVNRVKTIVSDLRMFTHPDTEQRDQVPVAEVVTAALRFLNNEQKYQVQFEQDLPANQTIWANKNKLIHVLTNLLQNSLDALKTKTFTDEQPTIRIFGRMKNDASFLTVHDNGPGIAADHLDKIYDPFFTTKNVGEGMGLGLSICYRIVREAKGNISVKTEPGKFCEFTLEFPTGEKNHATN
jgi:two-component system sensor histidine kinase PhcS